MVGLRKWASLLVAPLLALGISACGQPQASGNAPAGGGSSSDGIQSMTIKISHVVAEDTPKHQGALAMKATIEKESGGKIKVQVYPNSQLFGDKDEYQNLVANNVQFIIPDMAKLVGNDPGFNIPSMPFLFDSDQAAEAFWDGPKGQEIFKHLEKDGVLGLAMWPNGPKSITNNVRPIRSPEDMKGLKFRTQGGQVLEKVYSTLGAGSVSIPFDELYTALQQGTVDGEENTFSNIESKKFYEVQKYMTITNHTRVDYVLLTNTKFWNSLNDATRKIIMDGVKAGTQVARDKAAQLNADALEKIKATGKMQIYTLTPEDVQKWRDALKPVYDEWTSKIGADVIQDAMSHNKK
ncbi:MAG: DctP family TRAP transporter solute-binding subunit [Alicyclobacillus macrosporangiidus]|uniref:DctP family TRAP transporter solute-binding subunit n=1 Tax=Alicyclobacillus macrosporangiidus TaxID=392015 RepID=UPI0026F11FE4|nr:DctP family TRAP transporter solute-binding subunit [Alicyclobacillus macrosporangiidus]MCL6597545.1 DctP family TRAP transporter solute-binding subunit [Alicyclobacillus macrosporangiidus]